MLWTNIFQEDGLDEVVQFLGIVYKTQVRDIDQLKTRVRDAITTVDVGMLARTWQEIEYRHDILRATNGAHVQLY
jgi:hypothetical protein